MITVDSCREIGIKFENCDVLDGAKDIYVSSWSKKFLNAETPLQNKSYQDEWGNAIIKEFVFRKNTGDMIYPKGLPVEVIFWNGVSDHGRAGIDYCCDDFTPLKNDETFLIAYHRPNLKKIIEMYPEYCI